MNANRCHVQTWAALRGSFVTGKKVRVVTREKDPFGSYKGTRQLSRMRTHLIREKRTQDKGKHLHNTFLALILDENGKDVLLERNTSAHRLITTIQMKAMCVQAG